MATNDEIIPIEDALKEIRDGVYLKSDSWSNEEVAKVVELYYKKGYDWAAEARSEGYKEGENAERQRCIENFKKVLSNLKEQQEEEYSRLGTPQQRIRNEGWLGCCSYLLNQLPKLFKKVD